MTAQLRAKAVMVKNGPLVDATIIASASEDDRWVKHKGKRAVHGFKAHVGADADTAPIEESRSPRPTSTMARRDLQPCPTIPARYLPTVPTAVPTSAMQSGQKAASPGSSRPVCGDATSRKRCVSWTTRKTPGV
ncbi:hypothetical protein NOVOSPHI9U_600014 [Novosphingobium sp. 9U]|nr:hypothetical protein NOVOSPHI9U_600014 [Novosphingobium sp. 9U]